MDNLQIYPKLDNSDKLSEIFIQCSDMDKFSNSESFPLGSADVCPAGPEQLAFPHREMDKKFKGTDKPFSISRWGRLADMDKIWVIRWGKAFRNKMWMWITSLRTIGYPKSFK